MIDWKQTGSQQRVLAERSYRLFNIQAVTVDTSCRQMQEGLKIKQHLSLVILKRNHQSFSIKLLSDINANANVIDVRLHPLVTSIFCCLKLL